MMFINTVAYFLASLLFLAAYCYTLFTAHILLARVDKTMPVPRHINGELRLRDIKVIALLCTEGTAHDIKRSIRFMRLSNYIACAYVVLFFIYMLSDISNHS